MGVEIGQKNLPTEREMHFLLIRVDKTRSKIFEIRPFCSNPAIWEAHWEALAGSEQKGSISRKYSFEKMAFKVLLFVSSVLVFRSSYLGNYPGYLFETCRQVAEDDQVYFQNVRFGQHMQISAPQGHFGWPSEHSLTQPKRGIAFIHSQCPCQNPVSCLWWSSYSSASGTLWAAF